MVTRRGFAAGLAAVLAAAPPAVAQGARPAFRWPDGARAAVSLTYDDGLDSQLDHAAPQLEALGLRGTFFLTRENMEARLADWLALARRGHEIADHTVSHPCELAGYSRAAFDRQEVVPMERFLDANFGPGEHSFAYPCGETRLGRGGSWIERARYRQVVRRNFLAARTVDGPPNAPARVLEDRWRLHAFEPTYEDDAPAQAFAYLDQAVAQGGWAILVFHEVLPKRLDEGDTSLEVHDAILRAIADRPLWCAPMAEAFRYVRERRA